MVKEALEYIAEKFNPQRVVETVGDRAYRITPDENGLSLGELIQTPEAQPLPLRTLAGFVAAFNASIDKFDPKAVIVHVADHLTVRLLAVEADTFGRRHCFLSAVCAEKNPFPFDEYVTPEKFLLNLQGGFLPTDDVINLQRLASSLTTENSVGVADDGLSQVITVKSGTVTRDAVQLPPRIPLFAYRTFREVDPVKSEFLVRLKGNPGNLPSIALLQIDADKWKTDTMGVMGQWLTQRLPVGTPIIA